MIEVRTSSAEDGAARNVSVLYVGGYGRSGSTVIDMALAQFPGVFGAGELGNLPRHVWPNDEYCACGARVRACPLWSSIVERWLEREPPGTMERYGHLCVRFEAVRNPLQTLGVTGWTRGFQEYARLTKNLFTAIQETTGCRVIVDSSKSPSRALQLSRIAGIDLSLLHLMRDGRGVAWSMMKTHEVDLSAGVQRPVGGAPAIRTAHRWMAFNLLTEFAASRVGAQRSIQLRYEDFTADPVGALQPVLAMVEAARETSDATDLAEIIPGHQVAGSRIRMGGPLRISRDAAWEVKMPEQDRLKVQRRAGWMLRRYRYL
ncbi:sulfotransferase [Rhodophyticola porphyridii]|uniref:Sulfotransferase n=1 Tax=Rhodophyticola porphyridii TaxID=1852017 RepID=A0A3L9YF27_9RHOB|nr:sulfotransferase [Rhodophyticola porphyridii]RMA41550.1 sulfotransferase [Rhodophyticola porphyridii]